MRLYVSYWAKEIYDYPLDITLVVRTDKITDHTIEYIKTAIVNDLGENIDENSIVIMNIIKLENGRQY
jgi:hypothetical protein